MDEFFRRLPEVKPQNIKGRMPRMGSIFFTCSFEKIPENFIQTGKGLLMKNHLDINRLEHLP